ncbi:MAG TPA: response regulator [Methylocella sp.]|jgi:two-component system response regulator FixJ
MKHDAIVYVIDDDAAIRDALSVLLETCGLRYRTFGSAEDFLGSLKDTTPVCAVVDVGLPGLSGLELQQQLSSREIPSSLVVMTGRGNVPMAVEAMRAGAVHFIEKPIDPKTLLEVLDEALLRRDAVAEQSARRRQNQARIDRLTPREREVLALIVDGHMNKVIAGRLGISTRTAEHHRAHIMAKMEAPTLSHLIRNTQGFLNLLRPA